MKFVQIKKKQNGITLVALVITIIILLLLATVSIKLAIDNGLIEKTKLSKETHRASAIQEQIDLFKNEQEIAKYNGGTDKTINDLIDELAEQKLITEEEKSTIIQTGKITIGEEKIIFVVLPEGYTRVEYLKSTGTQYIDTEFIPKKDAKLEMELKFDGNFKNENVGVFGIKDSKSSFSLNYGGLISQANHLFCWCESREKDNNKIRWLPINDNFRTNKNKITFQSEKFIYGNLTTDMATRVSDNIESLVIFGVNYNKEYKPFNAYNMYVYSCKLYNGKKLEKDFIPCLDTNNTPCMYDTVTGKTFYNNGTGEFIAGPVID